MAQFDFGGLAHVGNQGNPFCCAFHVLLRVEKVVLLHHFGSQFGVLIPVQHVHLAFDCFDVLPVTVIRGHQLIVANLEIF